MLVEEKQNGKFSDIYSGFSSTYITIEEDDKGEKICTQTQLNAERSLDIKAGETKTYTIKILVNSTLSSTALYTNTAKYSYNGKVVISSDYFTGIGEAIQLHKFINDVDMAELNKHSVSLTSIGNKRLGMSEREKSRKPVEIGDNGETHTVQYIIRINNISDQPVTGDFYDACDAKIKPIGLFVNYVHWEFTFDGKKAVNHLTISPNNWVDIIFEAEVEEGTDPGIYMNEASFTWTHPIYKTSIRSTSSDWIEIDQAGKEAVITKKYIKSVNGVDVVDRSDFNLVTKEGKPVGVEKGDIVTYVIELTNKVKYKNVSAVNYCSIDGGLGNTKGEYGPNYKENKLDWLSCVDIFASGLQYNDNYSYTAGTGVTPVVDGNKITFKWKDVKYNEKVKVEFSLKVTSSNMKKMNLENFVGDINYQFTWYKDILEHAYWYHGNKDCLGHHLCWINYRDIDETAYDSEGADEELIDNDENENEEFEDDYFKEEEDDEESEEGEVIPETPVVPETPEEIPAWLGTIIKRTFARCAYGGKNGGHNITNKSFDDPYKEYINSKTEQSKHCYKWYTTSWVVNNINPKQIGGTYYSGEVDTTDSDFVRLLDPEVGGVVWLEKVDKDGKVNGLKDSDEGICDVYDADGNKIISGMSRDGHKNITVELWRAGYGSGESAVPDTMIATTKVNTTTGAFSFGRVKKGPGEIISSNSSLTAIPDCAIPNDLAFQYSNDTLYNYYLVYDYDGERYTSTTYSGMNNLNTKDHYIMTTTQIENEKKEKVNVQYFINDSNAKESEAERAEFNKAFETISYNKAYAGTESSAASRELLYDVVPGVEDTSLQESVLKWDGDLTKDYTKSLTLKATSFKFYFNGGINGDDTEYLKHINLGLIERGKPNLSLTKDVVNAEVTINNHITTYNYNSLGKNSYMANKNNVLTPPYTLNIYREDYEYRTAKYDTEIQSIVNENNEYTDFGRDNDLNIILTYKIKVTNDSPTATAVVREIIDYSSKEMEFLDGTAILVENETETAESEETTDETEEESEISNVLTISDASIFSNPTYNIIEEETEDEEDVGIKYNQQFITGEALNARTLAPGESLEIELRYKVLRDDENYILIDETTDSTDDGKANIAEIGAYSFYNGSEVAGLVDTNSNPGNLTFDDDGNVVQTSFEDDTFETSCLVVLKDQPDSDTDTDTDTETERTKEYYRNISGLVFEEKDKTSLADGQNIGNGLKDGNDSGAANVLVKLYEVVQKKNDDGSVAEEYYVDTGVWYRTDNTGKYYFGDKTEKFDANNKPVNSESKEESTYDCYKLHAGLYVTRFIYGDEAEKFSTTDGNKIKYSGQDYQSVKYTNLGETKEEDEIVKPTVFTTESENVKPFDSNGKPTHGSKICSVAKDNEVRRLEVNSYSTTTTYPMDTVLKAQYNRNEAGELEVSNEQKILAAHTSMFADTKTFDLDIEYYDNYISTTDFTIDGTQIDIEKYYYSVRDINFGLTERPRTKLQLMNDITEVKAITSDGNTILDALFDVTYTPQFDSSGRLTGVKHEPKLSKSSIGIDKVQALNRDNFNQGFRYVNVDSNILQGMTIIIKYKVAIANISEVDHLSKWLEEKIEDNSKVELNVSSYDIDTDTTKTIRSANGAVVTDYINGQERKYYYNESYLYRLLYYGDTDKGIKSLKDSDTGIHKYDTTAKYIGSKDVTAIYTYTNIKNKSHSDYKTGYYLGNIYYDNNFTGEAKVKTRVDQYIDYVDNDLIFKPEENLNSNNQITYLTYTTEEIANRGLLKDITPYVTSISDGKKDYYNSQTSNTNNNLAFNIEDKDINPYFYKFLRPITISYNGMELDDDNLYTIYLQASKVLTSEIELDGVELDNVAEIIKATNTAGRKVYVKDSNNVTGFLGNTTKNPIESISTKSVVDIAKLETDTDFTEYVTFSPPTGLNKQDVIIKDIVDKTGNILLIIIPIIIIIAGVSYVTIQVVKRKKFYK